ncbi:hypothetical protein [Streptomyces sp. NPDC051364]
MVKRKMSNYKLKRIPHRNGPQPTRDPAEAVRIAPHYRTVSANNQRKPL